MFQSRSKNSLSPKAYILSRISAMKAARKAHSASSASTAIVMAFTTIRMSKNKRKSLLEGKEVHQKMTNSQKG